MIVTHLKPDTLGGAAHVGGVYLLLDRDGVVIYVGRCGHWVARRWLHTRQEYWPDVADIYVLSWPATVDQVEANERALIARLQPRLNIAWTSRPLKVPPPRPRQPASAADLTTGDVARLLGSSPDSVARIPVEQLDRWVTPGKHRRYRRVDVERYAREHLGRELADE